LSIRIPSGGQQLRQSRLAEMLVSVGNSGTSRPVYRSVRVAMLAALSIALTSCNSVILSNDPKNDVDVLDKVRSLDLLPRYPQQIGSEDLAAGKRPRPAVYNGIEVAAVGDGGPQTQNQAQSSGNGFELNFENTPVATVAKVVLGDILRVGYTIDPRVQGTVTLASVRPVAKSDIIFVLESALRLGGVVLTRDVSGYHLIPLGDAAGSGNVEAAGANQEAGYGITVVPLQYVSAQTLLKLLDSFALKPGAVRADARRNLLLIQGTGVERRTAVEAAQSFDADWMRGQSVGIYPIANGNPEPIIAELEKIMDSGDNGLGQNVVKFQVISRMNAIMVITPKPAALRIAETWIKRLDSANTSKNSVHVYRVKYGEARQIARVLTDMFIGGSSSSADTQSNQLAPGSGASATSSAADRLSLNSSSSQSSGFGGSGGQSGAGVVANRGFGGAPATPNSATGGASGGYASGGSGFGGSSSPASGGAGKPILEGIRITPDVVNNTLLIYADQENYRLIEGTLRQVDRPQLQVAIDATVAEVTLNDTLAYGVQSFITSKQLGLKGDQGSMLTTNSATSSTATSAASAAGSVANAFINRAIPGFNFLVGSGAQPAMILDALNTLTSVKVLSNPSLVVIDNQVATLQVGDSVPVSTGSATVLTTNNTVVNTIDYRNTGIILRVSPRVNVNGNVRLDIEQEISNVAPATAASLTPTVSERKVKSSISVASGQTVLLAGLISETRQGSRNGIPILDDLPYIGDAFGHQTKSGTRTELIIFIRPQIIRDGTDAHYVAEELRSKLRGTIKANVENAGVSQGYGVQ
jgi:general secretion pathway protein D